VPTPPTNTPRVAALAAAPVQAVAPAGEIVPLAQVVEAPPAAVPTLPKTASRLPLLALLGLFAVGAAGILSFRRVQCVR